MRSGWLMTGLAALCLIAGRSPAADGQAVFEKNCLMCHQSGGAGLPGQFPRLAGRVAPISAKPKGRIYLIELLTYGMTGTVHVDGQDILGLMPPFAHVPDDEVAAVLNYVQGLGDPPRTAPDAFTAGEVHAARAAPAKSAAEVYAARKALGLDKHKP